MDTYKDLDTPVLLLDREKLMRNIQFVQAYADQYKVSLRPHTKTHKMPYLAKLQVEAGAGGITVAKVGEAEVMAKAGIKDIFIANEIVGKQKLKRIKKLSKEINISFGVDSIEHVKTIEDIFDKENKAEILIEIEVGDKRTGIIRKKDFLDLVKYIKTCKNIRLKGIFSHEGHTYAVKNLDELKEAFFESQKKTLSFAKLSEDLGEKLEVVSIGATPPTIHRLPILEGVTEIRPGTYILMDMGQANALGSHDRCAATILSTIISKPTSERVVTDVGAKGLTMQKRDKGICATKGLGYIKDYSVYIDKLNDEHAIIYDKEFNRQVKIGDKVEIIPNHICPVCNLYDRAYLVSDGKVIKRIEISCRGKMT